MNSFLVILSLSCLAAVTFASPTEDIVVEFMANGRARCRSTSCGRNGIVGAACPPTNCPPRQPPTQCGSQPNCNIVANRAWLHTHTNPNFYWQCAPYSGENDWRPIERPCACGTLFVENRNRCQHPHEWTAQCPGQNPTLRQCDEDCGPVCDGGGNPVPPGGNPTPGPIAPTPGPTQAPPVTPPINQPPGGGGDCPCVCIPCIFWPCNPCTASRTGCACSNQQNQQRPQPQPLPEPPRNNPWARPEVQPPTHWVPEAPRQPPQQWIPEAPRQPEWQPPRNNPWARPEFPVQPPNHWVPEAPRHPPTQWVPNPPQHNPWQRPFGAEEEVESKEEIAAEDEAL